MTGVLYGLAKFCVRHRYVTIAVWLVVTIALVGVSHGLGENTNDNLSLPGTDSQHATDTLNHSFPDQANGTSPIVLHASKGKLTESKYANAVNEAAADVAKAPHVASVVNPLTPQGAAALEQGQVDRLSVGDAWRSAPANCRSQKRRRSSTRPTQPRLPGWRSRPAASWARRSPKRRPSPAS